MLHGGGAHYSYFLEFLHPPDQFFPPNTRSVLSRKHYSSYKTWICPYISRHLLSLNPLQARCRRYSRG
ncbi:hypothetical protein F9Z83_24230, partial [Escherichia coli]